MLYCDKCGKPVGEYLMTAFGEPVCEDCWDEHICTKEGKLEYLIGICRGDYPAIDFDDDFLKEVIESWNANKNLVRTVSPAEFPLIEMKAQVLAKLLIRSDCYEKV